MTTDDNNVQGIINLAGLMGSVGAVIVLVAYFALPVHRRSVLRRLLTYQSIASFFQGAHYLQVGLLHLSPAACAIDATLLILSLASSSFWSCCIAFHLYLERTSREFRSRAGATAERVAIVVPFVITLVLIVDSSILAATHEASFDEDAITGCTVASSTRRVAYYGVPLIMCFTMSFILYVGWLTSYFRHGQTSAVISPALRPTNFRDGGVGENINNNHNDGPVNALEEDLTLLGIPLTERGVEQMRYHLILLSFVISRGCVVALVAKMSSGNSLPTTALAYVYALEALQGFINAVFFVLCFM
eukprot:PhM_4_TR2098/c2_g1_i2/m.36881